MSETCCDRDDRLIVGVAGGDWLHALALVVPHSMSILDY